MVLRAAAGAAAGVVVLAAGAAAWSHHSFAMFDHQNQVKLSGTVAEFTWQNPHVYIELDGSDVNKAGSPRRHWTIECANPGILNRIGWKWNMIKKGDTITVIVAPYRTGQPAALLKQVTLPDGRKFGNGAPAGAPTIE